ncbi:cache domain-containing sensor histidine kinase [Paenibacillus rigui]|uniref:HAMP domain-containing protein n=1 Tax=Paenibacillus rigui TaxID=554312 RepID=A0A229USZ2_9BACL|nr:sensor histidine kinase [Paenibacillus rigui]OXM86480.1 hypothetical protein CF651_09905 [Paenibacillus rigui]
MRTSRYANYSSLFQRTKLSTLMATCFIILNLTFLLTIIWIAYSSFSGVTFTEISKARLALLNESTKRGFDFITNLTNTAYSVVSNKEVVDRLDGKSISKYEMITKRREISDILHHTLVLNTGISSIEIYSDLYNEVPYAATDLVYPIRLIADKEWFPALKQADAVWVPVQEKGSPDSLIGYAQHVFNSKGETVGYVLIRMSQNDVLRKFADVPMALDGQVLVVDTAGKIIVKVDSPQQKETEPIVDSNWLGERSYSLTDGFEVFRKDGHSYLVVFSKPSTVQWRLVQIIPVSSLLASTQQAGWVVLGIGVLILFISAILAFLFVKSSINPLRRLMMEMKKLERGDFHAHSASSYTEEYVQLSYSFNHMVSRLKDLMDSVKKESKAKREAQTSLLEAQIKPHFLYNTLDMIHWRALDYKAEDISFMIQQLGKMLRIGLSGGKLFIRLRDELEHARCYISIQKERLPFPIEYTEQVEPRARSYYIPKIILQPLIENAVIHGKPGQEEKPLQIGLTIRQIQPEGRAPYLELQLTDNGTGLPEHWELEHTTGIGIQNVRRRIQLYCGSFYGLRMANREEGGVAVTVHLPVIETEDQLKQWLDGENE